MIAIITVVYNNYEMLYAFIDGLNSQTSHNAHLYIADVSSTKETIDVKRCLLPTTIIDTDNKGYAHGINMGIHRAQQDSITHFVAMNNDVDIPTTFISSLEQAFINHPHTVIGPKIYYANGFEYHTSRYSAGDRGKVLWYAGGSIDMNHILTHHRGIDEVDTGLYDRAESTGFVSGCCMAFDQVVLDTLGLWDESYFMYFEDADYCQRALKNNIPLWYEPAIYFWHKESQSTGGSKGSTIREYYMRKNRLKFGLMYAPLKTKLHLLINTALVTLKLREGV